MIKGMLNIFKSQIILNIVRILLLVNTLLIKQFSNNIIALYKHLATRIIVAILVAILAYIDPVAAVLLAVTFVIGYQEANSRVNVPSSVLNNVINSSNNNDVMQNNDMDVNVTMPIGKNVIDDEVHPAHNSLTENIQLGEPDVRMMDEIQRNKVVADVGGVDPDEPIQAFSNSNDAQGMNFIKGYNSASCCSSKM